MASVNKVIIVGNLGQDPEVRQFQNGGSVTSISVATSDRWTDRNTGEQKEQTEWHRVSLFNRLGEIAAQYLRKGSSVYIEGSLHTRKYTDNQGIERYSTEIRANQMQMLGARNSGSYSGDQGGQDHGYQGQGNYSNQNYQGQGGGYQNNRGGYNNPNNQNYSQHGSYGSGNQEFNQGGGRAPSYQNNAPNQGFGNAPQNNQFMANDAPLAPPPQTQPKGAPKAQPKADGAPQPVDDDMPF